MQFVRFHQKPNLTCLYNELMFGKGINIGLGTIAMVSALFLPASYLANRWPRLQSCMILLREYQGVTCVASKGKLVSIYGSCPICGLAGGHCADCPNARFVAFYSSSGKSVASWEALGIRWNVYSRADRRSYSLAIPLAYVTLASAIMPISALFRSCRQRRRARNGQCLRCGYDLRGSESGVCPECGTALARKSPDGAPQYLQIAECERRST